MLAFAALTPHPPIIVPEVGRDQTAKVQKTIDAMQRLNKIFVQQKAEVVFIISPHTLTDTDRFNLLSSPVFAGSLTMFGAPEVHLAFGTDQDLALEIQGKAKKAKIPLRLLHDPELDHASLVPLYYLSQEHHAFALLVSSLAGLSLKEHFRYGQILGQIFTQYPKKVAVIASGDLSHRLLPEAPAGYSPRGAEFDAKVVSCLERNDLSGLMGLDPELVEQAGECGLRSVVILSGVLSGFASVPQILAYESPFGVGYLTAYFALQRQKKT